MPSGKSRGRTKRRPPAQPSPSSVTDVLAGRERDQVLHRLKTDVMTLVFYGVTRKDLMATIREAIQEARSLMK